MQDGIVTISNVQGAEGKKSEIDAIRKEFQVPFGAVLINKLRQVLGTKFTVDCLKIMPEELEFIGRLLE